MTSGQSVVKSCRRHATHDVTDKEDAAECYEDEVDVERDSDRCATCDGPRKDASSHGWCQAPGTRITQI